jgi:adenylate cyclase
MSRLSKAIIVSLLIGTLGVIASMVPVGITLEENIGLDVLFRLRGERKPPSDVTIVSLDKASADYFKLPIDPDKWPRSFHARLTEYLAKQGAAVIIFDLIFKDPGPVEDDNLFTKAINNAGNVVLCVCLEKDTVPLKSKDGTHTGELIIERLMPPIPPFAQSALALAPFPLPKVPVKVSQYWTFKTEAGDAPTLPITAFQIFALKVYDEFFRLLEKVAPSKAEKLLYDQDAIIKNRWVEESILILRDLFKENPLIGKKMIEEIQNSKVLDVKKKKILKSLVKIYQGPQSRYLNFYGPSGTIETVSYYQLLQHHEKSVVKQRPLDLRGKAVFVGLSENFRFEQKDGFYTVFSQSSGLDISGVEIAASAFANLLEDKPVQPMVFPAHHATIFFWGILLGILCFFIPPLIAAFSVISLSILYIGVALSQFNHAGIWCPVVIPLFFQVPVAFFGIILWKFFETSRERQNIRRAFEYYLPEKVVGRLAKNLGDIKTNIQTVYGTCLFTDAEQYTSLSEDMDPKKLTNFMNKYYEAVFQPVSKYEGFVSDIKGDSMLSIWATSNPDAALRKNACLAALDISSVAQQFKQDFDAFHLPTRIGLHSGYISLGNIGAIDHYEYRPVGDIVNTASRIEKLNKYLGTRILISEEVLHQIEGFLTRKLGEFIFVGKSKPVTVYELISRTEESIEQQRNLCAIFTEGLNAYYEQSWEEAIKSFYESSKINRQDGPSAFYLHLCEKYKVNPPGEVWDGWVRLRNKLEIVL